VGLEGSKARSPFGYGAEKPCCQGKRGVLDPGFPGLGGGRLGRWLGGRTGAGKVGRSPKAQFPGPASNENPTAKGKTVECTARKSKPAADGRHNSGHWCEGGGGNRRSLAFQEGSCFDGALGGDNKHFIRRQADAHRDDGKWGARRSALSGAGGPVFDGPFPDGGSKPEGLREAAARGLSEGGESSLVFLARSAPCGLSRPPVAPRCSDEGETSGSPFDPGGGETKRTGRRRALGRLTGAETLFRGCGAPVCRPAGTGGRPGIQGPFGRRRARVPSSGTGHGPELGSAHEVGSLKRGEGLCTPAVGIGGGPRWGPRVLGWGPHVPGMSGRSLFDLIGRHDGGQDEARAGPGPDQPTQLARETGGGAWRSRGRIPPPVLGFFRGTLERRPPGRLGRRRSSTPPFGGKAGGGGREGRRRFAGFDWRRDAGWDRFARNSRTDWPRTSSRSR